MDCFYIGRLSGIKGAAWQYTAIDVASSYTWAEIHVTPKNPSARYTSALARRVAQDLVRRGWRLEKVMTDNASEFRASDFTGTVERRHGHHVFIRAGRPQTNGCVERVQRTILQECWRPAFARYLIPKITGLRLDLDRYLNYYNGPCSQSPGEPSYERVVQDRRGGSIYNMSQSSGELLAPVVNVPRRSLGPSVLA